MFKHTIILILATQMLTAAVWSSTQMQIATTTLSPFISAEMSALVAKTTAVNAKYTLSTRAKAEAKNTLTTQIRTLEEEILLELKKIRFNQTYLNRIETAEQ